MIINRHGFQFRISSMENNFVHFSVTSEFLFGPSCQSGNKSLEVNTLGWFGVFLKDDVLTSIREIFTPTLVFCPRPSSCHQEHQWKVSIDFWLVLYLPELRWTDHLHYKGIYLVGFPNQQVSTNTVMCQSVFFNISSGFINQVSISHTFCRLNFQESKLYPKILYSLPTKTGVVLWNVDVSSCSPLRVGGSASQCGFVFLFCIWKLRLHLGLVLRFSLYGEHRVSLHPLKNGEMRGVNL